MFRLKALILTATLLLSVFRGAAQNVYADPELNRPLRIEIPASSDRESYRILPCAEQGMLLFYRSAEQPAGEQVKWYFTMYDQNFQVLWSKSVPLNVSVDFAGSDGTSDTLALFFQPQEKERSAATPFQLLRVVLQKGSFILNNGDMPHLASMAVFSISGQTCFAGLNIRNSQAQLMILDLPTGKLGFSQIGGGTQTSFVALEPDSTHSGFVAVVRKQLTKRFWDNYFIRIGTDGTISGETLITTLTPERQLADSKICNTTGDGKLVAGSYVLTSSVTDQQYTGGTAKATGYFAAGFSGLTERKVTFSNFLDLKSADRFLSERDIIALRKKSVKKNRIPTEYSTDLNILLHEVIRIGEQYVVLGESYYLQYHTESFTDFDFYGRPYSNSYSVFDGYRFTSAIAAAYDADGNLLWDNSMEIRNLLTPNLDTKVALMPSGENIVLAYLSEGKIGYRIIREGTTVEKTDYTDIELSDPEDRLVNETKSRMAHWYRNYFLCYGFQEIKNLGVTGNATKLVFFCNKVRFD